MEKERNNYYCEQCGDDDLKNPVEDGTGSVFCNEYCVERSLEWRDECIRESINITKIKLWI
jgi:hypothetical protein